MVTGGNLFNPFNSMIICLSGPKIICRLPGKPGPARQRAAPARAWTGCPQTVRALCRPLERGPKRKARQSENRFLFSWVCLKIKIPYSFIIGILSGKVNIKIGCFMEILGQTPKTACFQGSSFSVQALLGFLRSLTIGARGENLRAKIPFQRGNIQNDRKSLPK